MGLFDNIRNFFRGAESTPVAQKDDSYERRILAEKIVDSINKVKGINAFDSSIWNLANVTVYDLQRRSLDELKDLQKMLTERLAVLDNQRKIGNSNMEDLTIAYWTGIKPKDMTSHDFDRGQRDGSR